MSSKVSDFFSFIPKVFLVDDDEDDRFLFMDVIAELGQKLCVKEFADGESLMHTLSNSVELPDIIFLDLNMPKRSGIECLSYLRKELGDTLTKVFIISTSSSRQMIDTTKDMGANHYICKPKEYSQLKTLLTIALQKAISPNPCPYLLNELVADYPNR